MGKKVGRFVNTTKNFYIHVHICKKTFGAHSKKIFFNASGTSTNELANTENKSTDSPSQTNLLDMCQISKMAKDLGIFIFNLI